MNSRSAIVATMEISLMVLRQYIADLSDAELLRRPGGGCNHIAWQLGHLIASECGLLESISAGSAPALPDGFKEKHGKENSASDAAHDFCSKERYLELLEQVHAASLRALDKCSDADLDRPGPEHFRKMFPTVGHIFVLIATHPLMHAGQFVPVRRALGKPVVI